MNPPDYPAGPFTAIDPADAIAIQTALRGLEETPSALRAAVAGLNNGQLDTRYRNWTLRQIVHHLADSQLNAYLRIKFAITEDRPVIMPFDEATWNATGDCLTAPVEPSLQLVESIHTRWGQLLVTLTPEQFLRPYFHPEKKADVPIAQALATYVWHIRHHTAQIVWRRQHDGF